MFNGIKICVLGKVKTMPELIGKDISYEKAIELARQEIEELENTYKPVMVKAGNITASVELMGGYSIFTENNTLNVNVNISGVKGIIEQNDSVMYTVGYERFFQNEKILKTAYANVCADMVIRVSDYSKELVPAFAVRCDKKGTINSKAEYIYSIISTIVGSSYNYNKERLLDTLGRWSAYLTFLK